MKLFLQLQRRGDNMALVGRQESSCLRRGIRPSYALTCGSNLPKWLPLLVASSVCRVTSALWYIHLACTTTHVICLHHSLAILIPIPHWAVDLIEVLYHLQIKIPLPVLRNSCHGLWTQAPVVVRPLSGPHVRRRRLYRHAIYIPHGLRRPLSF